MEPREDGSHGHAEWIRKLAAGRDAITNMTLRGIRLRVGDLACLASALPMLKVGRESY